MTMNRYTVERTERRDIVIFGPEAPRDQWPEHVLGEGRDGAFWAPPHAGALGGVDLEPGDGIVVWEYRPCPACQGGDDGDQ